MKRAYKIFWIAMILVIPVFPLSGILYGVDISDVGLSINQYRFCFEDITSVYLPILLSELIGGVWLKICGFLSVPTYLGVEILWVLVCYYFCFISYRLYRRYRDDALVLPALALALLFAKCNFHYFIYATGVAVMALTGLYFLVRAINDEKKIFLSVSVFFIVMACLCKISSIMQFAVFAVLFYDFYQKRDKSYFFRQILFCVFGFLAGLFAAFLLIQATCGLGEYADMMKEMFLYAGNSKDGHTIGNMIVSNAKGALRGALLVAACYLISLIPKKWKKSVPVFLVGILAVIVLLIVGYFAGLSGLPGFSAVYGILGAYLNALAILVALIYICVVLILRDKNYSQDFKNLALSAGLLTVIMPIGSNTGIQHICNESYFVLPFIAVCIGDRIRRTGFCRKRATEDGVGKTWRIAPGSHPAGVMIALAATVWCVGLTAYQSLYLTRARFATEKEVKAFALPELRGICYEADMVDELEEITEFLKQYEGGERKLLVAGAAPILNYLSGIPPFNAWCGGWIETEFITYEKIEAQLKAAEPEPIVVLCKTAVQEDKPKIRLVVDFVEEHDYREVFATEEYTVCEPVEGNAS